MVGCDGLLRDGPNTVSTVSARSEVESALGVRSALEDRSATTAAVNQHNTTFQCARSSTSREKKYNFQSNTVIVVVLEKCCKKLQIFDAQHFSVTLYTKCWSCRGAVVFFSANSFIVFYRDVPGAKGQKIHSITLYARIRIVVSAVLNMTSLVDVFCGIGNFIPRRTYYTLI